MIPRLAALAVASAALAACRQSEAPPRLGPDGKVHLIYWHSYNQEEQAVFDDLAGRFEREYAAANPDAPPIVIDGRGDTRGFAVPFDNMDQQLRTAAEAGETPDLVRIDYNKILSLAFGQIAVPLETLDAFSRLFPGETRQTLRERFVGAAYDACHLWRRGEQHLYALPEQVTCLALCWNRALFRARRQAIADEARRTGLPLSHERAPQTWEEFEAVGRALTWTDERRRRFGFGMRDSLWFALPILNVHHAELIRQDPATGHFSCDLSSDARVIAALDLMRGFYQGRGGHPGFEGGAWSAGADRTDRGFETGTYAMVLEGVWNLRRWDDTGLDYGVALIPRLSSEEAERLGIAPEDNTSATNLGGAGLVLIRSALERGVADEALAFMQWWTSAGTQAEWCRELGQIPVNLGAQAQLEGQVDERAAGFLAQSRFARTGPPVPLYGTLEVTIWNPNMVRVFQGALSAPEALARIEGGIRRDILTLVN